MLKWLWVLIAVVLSSGIYFSIRYGLRPKPIPLMKPTHFSSLEEVGVVTFRRMFQPIRSEKVMVLGYEPSRQDSILVWQGLVKAARESGLNIQKVYYMGEEELPSYFKRFKVEPLNLGQIESLQKELIRSRRRNGIFVFIVPRDEATHLMKNSFTKRLEASSLGPVLSISQLPLVLDPEKQEELSGACTELGKTSDQKRLQCITFKYAKSQWRRKIDPELIQGAIERYGLKEYLLFIHTPPPVVMPPEEPVEAI